MVPINQTQLLACDEIIFEPSSTLAPKAWCRGAAVYLLPRRSLALNEKQFRNKNKGKTSFKAIIPLRQRITRSLDMEYLVEEPGTEN